MEYQTLRSIYRKVDGRPFTAKHRNGRYAHMLGFGPQQTVLGWWFGTTTVESFPPDELEWTRPLSVKGDV
jgi:hypothetical protein